MGVSVCLNSAKSHFQVKMGHFTNYKHSVYDPCYCPWNSNIFVNNRMT